MRCVFDESGTEEVECSRKVANGRMVAGAITSLANARDLKLEWAKFLHETLLLPVLMYGSVTMLWKEKERSGVIAVRMGNLRGLLGIRRMDRVPNAWIREMRGVMKGVDKMFPGSSAICRELRMIAKRVYVGDRAGRDGLILGIV